MSRINLKDTRSIDISKVPDIIATELPETLIPSSASLSPEEWNAPAMFGKVQIWGKIGLHDDQILTVGKDWVDSFTSGKISSRTAVRGLQLALSLKSMIPERQYPLFQQHDRSDTTSQNIIAAEDLPAIDKFHSSVYPLKDALSLNPDQQRVPSVSPDNANSSNNRSDNSTEPEEEDDKEKLVNSYCFLAAYLMRVIVKSASNAVGGLETMKSRYAAFYGPSKMIWGLKLSLPSVTSYKEALVNQSLLCNTFTHAVANTHQSYANGYTQQELGAFSYLGALPFSYTGMHAYNLLLQIMTASGQSMRKLLNLVNCDITSAAVREIINLVRNHERTNEKPNNNVTFRYCTLWSPRYFSNLRSKHSPHLVYCLACTWKVLNNSDDNSDPERIAAVNKISDDLKATLRSAGQILGNSLRDAMMKGANSCPVFGTAITPDPRVTGIDQAIVPTEQDFAHLLSSEDEESEEE